MWERAKKRMMRYPRGPDRRRRSFRWKSGVWALLSGLVGMLLGALLLAYFAAGVVYDYQDTIRANHLPQVDVIVCLAGGKGRIGAAAELWYRYWVKSQENPEENKLPLLFYSGIGHRSDWATLSRQIRPEILKVLIQKEIILENFSLNTDENAKWLLSFVREKGWDSIALVTSSYHMRRAQFILENVLGKAGKIRIETYSVQQEPFSPGKWHRDWQGLQVTLTEFFKFVVYRVAWNP